ncbi:MAG: substrate-binding domain-containing protein, partial [Pseudomonadota bacterium]
ERIVHERIKRFGDLTEGHLHVIANAPRPAMPALARFAELYPGVEVEFGLHDWTTAMEMLRAGEADAGLITEPQADPSLHCREVGRTRYAFHARRDHPIAGRLSASLRDIAEAHALILPEDGSFTQRVYRQAALAHGIEAQRIIKIRSFPALKEAVLHGLGVGLLLEDSLFPSRQLVTLDVEEMREAYANHVVIPVEKRDLAVVRRFGEAVVDVCASDAASARAV